MEKRRIASPHSPIAFLCPIQPAQEVSRFRMALEQSPGCIQMDFSISRLVQQSRPRDLTANCCSVSLCLLAGRRFRKARGLFQLRQNSTTLDLGYCSDPIQNLLAGLVPSIGQAGFVWAESPAWVISSVQISVVFLSNNRAGWEPTQA